MNNNNPYLYLQSDRSIDDDQIQMIDELISMITTDFEYDDLCGPTIMIKTKDLNRSLINHIITIGRNFGFHHVDI